MGPPLPRRRASSADKRPASQPKRERILFPPRESILPRSELGARARMDCSGVPFAVSGFCGLWPRGHRSHLLPRRSDLTANSLLVRAPFPGLLSHRTFLRRLKVDQRQGFIFYAFDWGFRGLAPSSPLSPFSVDFTRTPLFLS